MHFFPRRPLRWFQFSLGSLLALTTILVVLLAAWRNVVEPYRRQAGIAEAIAGLGGSCGTVEGDPWQLWLLGGDSVNVASINVAEVDDPAAYLPSVLQLPRLETLTVGGELFGDKHLARLAESRRLRTVVLDSTNVSAEALAAFRKQRPEVEVLLSNRRALTALDAAGFYYVEPRTALSGDPTPDAADLEITAAHVPDPVNDDGLKCLKWLPDLRRLEIASPNVTDAGLGHVLSLRNLESLSLIRTKVTEAGLARLRELPKLASVDLHDCALGDVGLAHLLALRSLKTLQVYNQASRFAVAPSSSSAATAEHPLELLVLDGTQVTDAGLAGVPTMPNLKCFAARGLSLGDAGLRWLVAHRNLHCAYVCGTTGIDPFEMPEIVARLADLAERDWGSEQQRRLKWLFLHHTRVSDQGLECLRDQSGLEKLSLVGNKLGDAGIVHLRELPALTSLILNRTEISDKALASLAPLKTLENLHLETTRITDDGLLQLKALPRLYGLYVGGSKATPRGIQRFKEMRRCQVFDAPRKLRECDIVRRWWE